MICNLFNCHLCTYNKNFFYIFCLFIFLIFNKQLLYFNHAEDNIRATINPYNPKASAKIKINIMPTKILSCKALHLTPQSPTIPIA